MSNGTGGFRLRHPAIQLQWIRCDGKSEEGMTLKADVEHGCDDMRQAVRLNRRGFVKAGILGAVGLSLAELLRCDARASQPARRPSVIVLWMRGGPSHIDMWDP